MFCFSMTPMPTSLRHFDGTICKTEKSAIMKILRNDSALPTHIDVVIVDGFYLILPVKDVPQLFGNISKISSDCDIVIKCSDIDIVVIMLGNLHKIKSKIYIECGISNGRHIIDVNAVHKLLGLDLCKALPEFHAFTSRNYNPAFFRKGKQRPFKIRV